MKRTDEWFEGYKQASMELFDDGWLHALKELVEMIDKAREDDHDNINKAGFDKVIEFVEELK